MGGWQIRQVDFVLAYTQAEVECELFMKIPKGFEMSQGGNFVLKLKKTSSSDKSKSLSTPHFFNDWDPETEEWDAGTAKSRTGGSIL